MSLINFQNNYEAYLKSEAQHLNNEIAKLTAENCLDEAKFARVQLNIVDIFSQMLTVSVQKSKNAPNWSDALSEAYLGFFEKIPSAWKVNLEKCQTHGLHEEAHIETIKLAMASKLREAFVTQLDQHLLNEKDVN